MTPFRHCEYLENKKFSLLLLQVLSIQCCSFELFDDFLHSHFSLVGLYLDCDWKISRWCGRRGLDGSTCHSQQIEQQDIDISSGKSSIVLYLIMYYIAIIEGCLHHCFIFYQFFFDNNWFWKCVWKHKRRKDIFHHHHVHWRPDACNNIWKCGLHNQQNVC